MCKKSNFLKPSELFQKSMDFALKSDKKCQVARLRGAYLMADNSDERKMIARKLLKAYLESNTDYIYLTPHDLLSKIGYVVQAASGEDEKIKSLPGGENAYTISNNNIYY